MNSCLAWKLKQFTVFVLVLSVIDHHTMNLMRLIYYIIALKVKKFPKSWLTMLIYARRSIPVTLVAILYDTSHKTLNEL